MQHARRLFEGYASRVFRNLSPRRDGVGFWKFVNPGLIWRALTGPYDAVYVHGNNHFTHVAAIAAARAGGKRVIFRADSYNLGERPPHVRLLRHLVYRALYRLAHVLLYIGHHNRRFFEDFGGRPEQLVHAPDGGGERAIRCRAGAPRTASRGAQDGARHPGGPQGRAVLRQVHGEEP